MDREAMLRALKALDRRLKKPARMLVGGGAAILLGHGISLSTLDIDGILVKTEVTPAELDPLVKGVARELKISPHWFTSYFATFTYTIPSDYETRIVPIYEGRFLKVYAFGLEDLLIMKCFSGREKDVGHARALIKKGADLAIVEKQIKKLFEKGLPGACEALAFLEDLKCQLGR